MKTIRVVLLFYFRTLPLTMQVFYWRAPLGKPQQKSSSINGRAIKRGGGKGPDY